MQMFETTVHQLSKMLANLDRWLEAAGAYATEKKFDVETLLHARLAPDMFALSRQIQAACDNAKIPVARLAGKEWPKQDDTEKTLAELRERIASTRAYLETFQAADFAGADERHISLPWMNGKWMRGDEYLTEFVWPNFYFHMATAYAILRHNGVPLGKQLYIGGHPMRD